MAATNDVTRQLLEFMAGKQAVIGEHVVRNIRSSGTISGAQALTDEELIDHFPQLFADLIEYFITNAHPQTRKKTIEAAVKHGRTRWRQGYQLTEVVQELGLVQKSILDHAIEKFFEEFPEQLDSRTAAWKNLAGFFEDSIAGSVQRYVENYTEELRIVNGRLLDVNRNLSRTDASRLRFIRTVSHEIANVLNTLNLTISLLTISDDEPSRDEMIRTCQRNVQEMSDLLEDLKNYSLLLDGADIPLVEAIDIHAFCSDLESSFRAMTIDAGQPLILEIDPALTTVRSDRKRIRRIITNLVINAINYRRPDGPNGTINLAFNSLDDKSWQISVEDSGIGIPPEHFETIFEEFKRITPSADTKGTGLGLAITKRLVEDMKGTIEVFSEVGKGTRFVLTLPKS